MDNPPPYFPQLVRAWTVCCMNKVSLTPVRVTPDPELNTPALEFAHSIPLANGPLRGQYNIEFSISYL